MAQVKTKHQSQNTNDLLNGKNAFQILMLVCLFYIVSQRDFSFTIGETKNETASSAYAYGFEDVDIDVKKNKKPHAKTVVLATAYETKEKAKKVEGVKKNLANQFQNTAFILDRNLAERGDISPEFVRAKNQICLSYVKKYTPIARTEQEKFGIPVSVTLAQGLLESDAGNSRLAKSATNHFGIKCFSHRCKKGHCKNFTDDTHKDFFVVYQNAWQSFRSHSQFLKQNRYENLFRLKKNDYKNWAKGLKSAGYATDKHYDEKLIKIIETLRLNQLD